jgi:hypothetical protein
MHKYKGERLRWNPGIQTVRILSVIKRFDSFGWTLTKLD